MTELSAKWLETLDVNELVAKAPPLAIIEMGGTLSIEDAVSYLYQGGPLPPQGSLDGGKRGTFGFITDKRPPKKYWECVKKEIYLLICTNDQKYDALRSRLEKYVDNSKTPLIAVIAGAIGDQLGISAVLIAGFCAVALYAVVKVGKETYCSSCREHYK